MESGIRKFKSLQFHCSSKNCGLVVACPGELDVDLRNEAASAALEICLS